MSCLKQPVRQGSNPCCDDSIIGLIHAIRLWTPQIMQKLLLQTFKSVRRSRPIDANIFTDRVKGRNHSRAKRLLDIRTHTWQVWLLGMRLLRSQWSSMWNTFVSHTYKKKHSKRDRGHSWLREVTLKVKVAQTRRSASNLVCIWIWINKQEAILTSCFGRFALCGVWWCFCIYEVPTIMSARKSVGICISHIRARECERYQIFLFTALVA